MKNIKPYLLLDKIGMCTSILCMVHCISIPFFILFGFDAVLRMVDQEWIEWVIIATALLVGLISFMGGFLSHRQHFIPVLFVAGFLLIINGESVSNDGMSLTLSLAGAGIIAYAHIQNLKWKKYAYRS